MNPANVISFFRIASLPLIIYFLSQRTVHASYWALAIYGFAMLSDVLDGIVSKNNSGGNTIGSFLDPLADKILIFGMLLFFAISAQFAWTFLFLLFIRDLFFLSFRFLSSREDILFLQRKMYEIAFTLGQFFLIFGLLVEHLIDGGSLRLLKYQSSIHAFVTSMESLVLVLAVLSLIHAILFYTREIRKKKRTSIEEKPMPLVIVANKRSRGYYNLYRRRLLGIFARRRGANIIFFPNTQNMYQGVDRDLAPHRRVIIAGGDGSFESALNYPSLNSKILGFFPLGAGNAFYSFFYKGKRYEYLRSRFPFKEIDLDVVQLEYAGGTRQTLFVNLGLDADVIRFSLDRTHHGFMDYVRGCWRALQNAQGSYNFVVRVDGRKRELSNCSTVILGKVPYFGYGIRSLVGAVKPADGKVYGLGVVNRHASWLNKPLRLWALLVGMFNFEVPPLLSFKGKELEITSTIPFPIQAGGEYLGESTWVRLRVIRKQKVLVV
ncbi:CDP-alcohol phosphatidyltransferase family protein [Candidatus Woesearchaeota archaeon]|nr:CDP-alcohol phosphatidyltransferase family protein [Candidatus Woesearchaeota archaeon]